MNAIVLVADSFRRDHLHAYKGSQRWVKTPNLDRLARRSAVFENAFAGSHPTVPNRTDAFTGKFTFPWRRWGPLPTDVPVIAEHLSKAGVATMLIGDTYHLFKENYYFARGFQGFEWIRGQEGDKWVTDADIPLDYPCPREKMRLPYPTRYDEIVRNRAGRKVEGDWLAPQVYARAIRWLEHNHQYERFFLWVDGFDPHEPWDPPKKYLDRYSSGPAGPDDCDNPPAGFWADYFTPEELKRMQARYAAEVTMVDTWVGKFLKKFESLGLAETTMLVFATDHGVYLGYPGDNGLINKCDQTAKGALPFYRSLIHVPLFVRAPGGMKGKVDGIVQPADLGATLLDWFGVQIPADFHGRSYLPLVRGEKKTHRDIALSCHRDAHVTVSDARWSYHVWPKEGAWKKALQSRPAPVLFDCEKDPLQEKNLLAGGIDAAPAEAREAAARMQSRLIGELKAIGAPEAFVAGLML
ncbi:MAG: sulfatase [Planctomycetota bacterium]